MKRYFTPSKSNDSSKVENESKFNRKKKFGESSSVKKLKKREGNEDEFHDEKPFQEEVVTVANLNQRRVRGGRNAKTSTRVPVPEEKLLKHKRGESINTSGIRGKFHKKVLERKEKLIEFSTEQAARTELLLTEDTGYLIADEGEDTADFTQSEIVKEVDITSAAKQFDLRLHQFGPYRMNYSRNGRYLLLGGYKGHLAAMDWVTKKLLCEINVMESIHDVKWLHTEAMFAVAQKNWTFIYDGQGIELHCLKNLHRITRLEFLPFHFLLASCHDTGVLTWLDVSVGKIVASFNARHGKLSIMTQNPQNALLCLGHSKGTVTMWSPNVKDPLVSMLCHKAPLTSLAVHPSGNYMATASTDRTLALWDLRNLAPLKKYRMNYAPKDICFSQKGLLASGFGKVIEVFRDCVNTPVNKPYMRHIPRGMFSQHSFCPYEDVLGVCTDIGFESLLIPGSGEANFDALESNPFQSKSQRREAEVKALLEKIPAELITLNTGAIAEVDVPTLKEKIEARQKLKHVRPPKIEWEKKRKGKGGPAAAAKTRRKLQEQSDKDFRKRIEGLQKSLSDDEECGDDDEDNKEKNNVKKEKEEEEPPPKHVLDRFKPKKKKK